jgi:hypothetical protein
LNHAWQRLVSTVQHLIDTIRMANVKARQRLHGGRAYSYERGKTWLAKWPLRKAIRHRGQRFVAFVYAIDWWGLMPQSWLFWVGIGALLLFIIGLVWGGAVGSLVIVAGTLGGVALGYWLSSEDSEH